ncbi:MAG: alkaline phosphatase family protein [Blastocatellia bacterium]|nr:alkaline phosphatase family protein [Blastocatellia bacterium]
MIKKRLPVQLILLFAILFSFNSLVTSKVVLSSQNKTANKTSNQAAKKASAIPKLTVLLVVDQFRADYLTRLKGLFGQKGFNRLIDQGANFTNAHYAYSNTYTAVGHTTIVTGSLPSIHGIVANKWFDRKENRLVRASEDDKTTPLGGKEGASPQQLLTTTFGDQLRLSNNYQSKSIGISIKERSAVFIAGRRATGAYWFDGSQGNMSSSSYFMKELPEWVIKFNKEGFADEYFQKNWDRKLPIEAYNIADKDDASYEATWKGNTITFPHIMDGNSKEKGQAFIDNLEILLF